MLKDLENKITELKEEKGFLSREIKNAKHYNLYLKNKLKELEASENINISDEITNKNNNNNFNTTNVNNNNTTNINNNSNIETKENKYNQETINKMEFYIKKNESIIKNKIHDIERQIKRKNERLNILENFNNPILQILNDKVKEYEINMINTKISNKDIFFNNNNYNNSGIVFIFYII